MKKALFAVVILIALVACAWWLHKPSASAEADDVKPVAQVQVSTLSKEPIVRTLTAYGSVESSAGGAYTVAVAYDCLVRAVASTKGARVAAGELLFTVDPTPDARLQMDSARSVAALTERSLASVRQRFDLRLATDDDLRTAEHADQDARLKKESLERRGLGNSGGRLTAPVAGIVVKLDAQPGVMIPASTPIAVIAVSDRLEARIGIEPSDAAAVKPGQRVLLNAVNRPGAQTMESVVGSVGAVADAATGSLEVRVPLPERNRWLPGERVQADIEVERKVAWVVPRSAVMPEGEQELMYTIKNGKAQKHTVHIGIFSGGKVEVSGSDLQAGDSVVVQGNYELSDGMAVQLKGADAGTDEGEPKP
jgi:RND family efflux transporter MFP subunit